MARVSVLIPSRNEVFLVKTVQDLLAKATGDLEIVVCCDGYYEHNLPEDKRVKVLHFGRARGMRPCLNAAVQISTGEYLLKADAHTLWDDGFDEKLAADYHEQNWILTCRRYALEPEAWVIDDSNPGKYPVDYHSLSYPYTLDKDGNQNGLHGEPWTARRDARKHIELDEELSTQGSMWFMSRKHWDRTIGQMDSVNYSNFIHEAQELGLRTWLSGGAMMITKRTFFAHLRKGRKYGRMYSLGPNGHKEAREFVTDFWMNDRWPDATRTMRWLVERFNPPGWPADLDAVFKGEAWAATN